MTSCTGTKNAMYFSRAEDTLFHTVFPIIENVIQKNDVLSISISSLNAEASSLFNGPNATTNSINLNATVGYLVNA